MKVKRESEVAQSCLTLSDPMDCRLPGSSVHGIFQARGLEWGAIAFSAFVSRYFFLNFLFDFFSDPLVTSVQFSHSVMSDSLWPHESQHARPPCPSPTPGVYSNSCPLSQWCHPTILSSVIPSPPTFNLPQHRGLFRWVSSSQQVAKVLEFQLQHQSFQWIFRTDFLYNGLVWPPCSPRDSQKSFPTPHFKSINCSLLSFLYSSTLTSIHDYWKNHSFD